MRDFFVTIVDLLGVLLPGLVLLAALCVCPPIFDDIAMIASKFSGSALKAPVGKESSERNSDSQPGALPVICVIVLVSYVLGFVVRLVAIRIVNRLTGKRWRDRLAESIRELHKVLASLLRPPELEASILAEVANRADDRGISRPAPLFHYAKRLVRAANPELWAEAERTEAEIRLAAGLLLPALLFAIDGVWWWWLGRGTSTTSSVLVFGSLLVFVATLTSVKERRIREIVFVHYMAILVLSGTLRIARDTAEGTKDGNPSAS